MSHDSTHSYDDGGILCDERGLTIRRYYPWGAKHIPYTSILGVKELPLTGVTRLWRWRIWGSDDFIHWWNFDAHRPRKNMALVIDVGHRVRPTITPDDANAVGRILAERTARTASR